jgi:hypothetical protein
VIAPFPRYELLKSPFTEFAFSPERDFAFEKIMAYETSGSRALVVKSAIRM